MWSMGTAVEANEATAYVGWRRLLAKRGGRWARQPPGNRQQPLTDGCVSRRAQAEREAVHGPGVKGVVLATKVVPPALVALA